MKRIAFLVFFAGLCLVTLELHAQSKALDEAQRQGKTLFNAGRYIEAIPIFARALEMSEREFGPDHPETAKALRRLAHSHKKSGRYAEAVPLYKRALRIFSAADGPEHRRVARGARPWTTGTSSSPR